MKNLKECPKCFSENIVRFDGFESTAGIGNSLKVSNNIFSLTVRVNRYVCCNCGFTEEWIDKEELDEVAASKFAKR